LRIIEHPKAINTNQRWISVALSANGQLAVSGLDNVIRVWNTSTGECLQTIPGVGTGDTLCLSKDGSSVLSENAGATIRIWSTISGQCLKTLEGHTKRISCQLLSQDESILVTGSFDKTVRLWNLATGACLRIFVGHEEGITSLDLSSDGSLLLSGSFDKTVRAWDTSTGACLRVFGHESAVEYVKLSPDGQFVLVTSGGDSIALWQISTAQCLKNFKHPNGGRFFNSIYAVGNLQYVFIAGIDHKIFLLNRETDQIIQTFLGHTDTIGSMALSADSQFLLSGGDDRLMKIWDVNTGQNLHTFEHDNRISLVFFSSDGKTVVAKSGHKLCFWSLETLQCLKALELPLAWECELNHDSSIALSPAYSGSFQLWNLSTGQCVQTFDGHREQVREIAWSADERLALSGSNDKTLRPELPPLTKTKTCAVSSLEPLSQSRLMGTNQRNSH
jgi:WD40 repeat protein